MKSNTNTQLSQTRTIQEGVGKEEEIYQRRFSLAEDQTRSVTWQILCKSFFQRYISTKAVVVDLGAGDGNFITNIQAGKKIAVDLIPSSKALAAKGVEVIIAPATEFASHLKAPVDVIFMSNFLEHLPDKRVLISVLEECSRALTKNGQVIILQPNIRYVGAAYWDYIDHHIALTEHSLVEALEINNFKVTELIPRFLPYTAKSKLGYFAQGWRAALFVKMYLRFPFIWRFLGQQTFIIARKL